MARLEETDERVTVREYRSQGDYQADAAAMIDLGWTVASVVEATQRPGCMRILTLGLFSLVFPPKPHLTVTYVWNDPETGISRRRRRR